MSTPYSSYAAIIKAIILADDVITECEREKFDDYFADYYELPREEREDLWISALSDDTPIEKHIGEVKKDLEGRPMAMVQFFKLLNSCIYSDTITKKEYETFEHIEELLLK